MPALAAPYTIWMAANLALRLEKGAAQFGHAPRHVLEQLRLRRDRITKKCLAAGANGRLCQGFIPLP